MGKFRCKRVIFSRLCSLVSDVLSKWLSYILMDIIYYTLTLNITHKYYILQINITYKTLIIYITHIYCKLHINILNTIINDIIINLN